MIGPCKLDETRDTNGSDLCNKFSGLAVLLAYKVRTVIM